MKKTTESIKKTAKKITKLEISILMALIITFSFSLVRFGDVCENIRENVLRLHVIANSDSDNDQSLKLLVRDAVLTKGAELFDGSVNVNNAANKIVPNIGLLEKAALEVIRENGYDYGVKITVGKEFFNTRSYGELTFPAGEYEAVRVIIGSGEGHNWWCVMFPPMCLPAASDTSVYAYLNKDGVAVINSSPKYEIRFRAVEIIEKARSYFNGKA
jgi:stage II sporulation protein R